jgi:hypothetical protein
LIDGTVFVAGGWSLGCPGTQDAVAIFKPTSSNFSPSVNLEEGRAEHTATLLNDGRVLITGGNYTDFCNYGGYTFDSALVFDPTNSSYSPELPMREARTGHSATLLTDGKVLVAGSLAELFDPSNSTFVITGDPNASRGNRRATRLSDGRVLFTGTASVAEIYE